jgi:hypothetical protein
MLQYGLKEWAVICRALAEGRQAQILRKGGIEEPAGTFHLEHRRFWLYPTYVHQQRAGVKPQALPLLEQAEAERPAAGVVRLAHFAEVAGIYQLHNLAAALAVDRLHLWSEETVRGRFAYRRPGLNVLPVRVYRAAQAVELPEEPSYAGCRSWVDLGRPLPTDGAVPVLSDEAFRDVVRALEGLIDPTAIV